MYETYSDRALLAENENFREYCHLLETAKDDELLCDYAAVLIHILPEVEHDYLFSLMKSQLYDRKMSVGRVERSSVWKLSAERGFSDATLRRAKAVLGLKVLRLGMQPNQKIFWYRGDMSEDAIRADILGQHEQLPLKPNPQKCKTHHSRHIDGCGSFADIITS